MLFGMGQAPNHYLQSWDVHRDERDGQRRWLGRIALDRQHILHLLDSDPDHGRALSSAIERLNQRDELLGPYHDPARPGVNLAIGTPRGHAEFPALLQRELGQLMFRLTPLAMADNGEGD